MDWSTIFTRPSQHSVHGGAKYYIRPFENLKQLYKLSKSDKSAYNFYKMYHRLWKEPFPHSVRLISAPTALSAAKMVVEWNNIPKLWNGKGEVVRNWNSRYLADILPLHRIGFLHFSYLPPSATKKILTNYEIYMNR